MDGDADFVRTRDSGFDLLTGRSYSSHSDDEETQATADGKVRLQPLVEARGELEIEPVTQQIEANPALQEGLLRLVNSLELDAPPLRVSRRRRVRGGPPKSPRRSAPIQRRCGDTSARRSTGSCG